MALDVYREIPSVLISTALGLRPRAVLISTSGIFPVYRLKPCVNLYILAAYIGNGHIVQLLLKYGADIYERDEVSCYLFKHVNYPFTTEWCRCF